MMAEITSPDFVSACAVPPRSWLAERGVFLDFWTPDAKTFLRGISQHRGNHTAITNDAAAGSSAIAVMTKAGHASMATTKQYLHLAGTVFRDEAEALERRLLGPKLSTEMSASEGT
jgi:hypothetical protein